MSLFGISILLSGPSDASTLHVLPLVLADVRHPSRVMEVEFEVYRQLDGRDVCGLHVMRMGCRYQESEEAVPANDAGERILENSYAGDPSLILRRGPSQR